MIASLPGTGWIPDLPSGKDYTARSPKVKALLERLELTGKGKEPEAVNLESFFPPVETQGPYQSCTAHAAVALLEYFYRRAIGQAFGNASNASRMFLYKVERNLLNQPAADKGAFLRTAMEAMRLIGVPPESVWSYSAENLYAEPPAYVYALAGNYKATTYFRLDPEGAANDEVLADLRRLLAAGLPSMFGTVLYSSLGQSAGSGKIPYPSATDTPVGAHALVAVGYQDDLEIENVDRLTGQRAKTVGALRIRNSWGPGWGEKGYGWLPYEYVLKGNADDYWCLARAEYVDLGAFDISGKSS